VQEGDTFWWEIVGLGTGLWDRIYCGGHSENLDQFWRGGFDGGGIGGERPNFFFFPPFDFCDDGNEMKTEQTDKLFGILESAFVRHYIERRERFAIALLLLQATENSGGRPA
jgi:hypothetical protein